MIAQSVPRPIVSVTSGGDNSAGCEYPLRRNCGIGFNAWATGAAYIFEQRRNDLDKDYLADFRALGLLEVQPGKSLSSMFRMHPCFVCGMQTERVKGTNQEDFSAARSDGEPNALSQAMHYSRAHAAVIRVYDITSRFFLSFPRSIGSAVADPEATKNRAGKRPPPDSDPFSDAEFGVNSATLSSQFAARASR